MTIQPDQFEIYEAMILSDQINAADLHSLLAGEPDFARWRQRRISARSGLFSIPEAALQWVRSASISQDLPEQRPDIFAHARERVWNVADFLEIQSIVGPDSAEALLRSYVLHLELTSALLRRAGCDATRVREMTHNLKSMSGQLGFEALHDFCDAVLVSTQVIDRDRVIEPLLALIDESREAVQSHGTRTKTVEMSRVA